MLLSLALAPGGGAAVMIVSAETIAEDLADAADWVITGDQQGGRYGYAVASGDFDGDGDDDVLVGGPRIEKDVYREGVVFLYEGGLGGLEMNPSWSMGGGLQGGLYGSAVANAGDVNGDDIEDILIGAPEHTDELPATATKEGLVELFYGEASGIGIGSVADWSFQSDQKDARLGNSVASAGDVNADGYDDVIVGSKYYSDTLHNEGAAFVFYGSAEGLADTPDWNAFGGQVGAAFGLDVAGAGDLNDDGYDDVVVGAPFYNKQVDESVQYDNGALYVYFGSDAGLSASPGWTLIGEVPDGALGYSVAGAGDVNDDGYDDLIAGAPRSDGNFATEGMAIVYLGSGDGLRHAWSYFGGVEAAYLGWDVGGLGDVDKDGYDDIVVGAYWYMDDQPAEGRVFVFEGSSYGPLFLPSWWADGDKSEATFGYAVSTAGDVNRDGNLDLIVGAPEYKTERDPVGLASVYYGLDLLDLAIERVFIPIVQNGLSE
jgi:hypothetical protein